MVFVSLADTSVVCLSLRLRFLLLLESRWLLPPRLLLTFPDAVTLNLFIAPLLLFILGITFSFS